MGRDGIGTGVAVGDGGGSVGVTVFVLVGSGADVATGVVELEEHPNRDKQTTKMKENVISAILCIFHARILHSSRRTR